MSPTCPPKLLSPIIALLLDCIEYVTRLCVYTELLVTENKGFGEFVKQLKNVQIILLKPTHTSLILKYLLSEKGKFGIFARTMVF